MHVATSRVPELHVCLFVFFPPRRPTFSLRFFFFLAHLRRFVCWTFQHLGGIEACGCGLFQLATLQVLAPNTTRGKSGFSSTCMFFVFMKVNVFFVAMSSPNSMRVLKVWGRWRSERSSDRLSGGFSFITATQTCLCAVEM